MSGQKERAEIRDDSGETMAEFSHGLATWGKGGS